MAVSSEYETLLDDEIKHFIAETERWYPPDAVDLSIAEQRQIYGKMCQAFAADRPNGVMTSDQFIEMADRVIPVRVYTSGVEGRATVIYYHGGGFVVGGLDSHCAVCAEICASTGFEVISVDYRLSPEHIFPNDFEDAFDAFQHVAKTRDCPVVLAGDSAGACLAAAVSHASREGACAPAGQVLIYPALGGDMRQGSYIEHSNAPMLTTEDVAFYHNTRTGGVLSVLDDPRCSPLRDQSFAELPATYIVSAECDPLAQDGEDYCRRISEAGDSTVWISEPGLVHGYLRARHSSDKARASFARIVTAIDAIGHTGLLPDD